MNMREKIEHEIEFKPCGVANLKFRFGGSKAENRQVMEAVDALVRSGVICQKEGIFFTVRSKRMEKMIPCKVVKLGKTFGFVMRDDLSGDLFVPGRFLMGAMPGDKVLVEKNERPRMEGSDEGQVIAITEKNNNFVGTVRRIEGKIKFVPDDCTTLYMEIARGCEGGAKDGDKVAIEIVSRARRQDDHKVSVVMKFGSADEAKQCAKALLFAQGVERSFPPEVKAAGKKYEGATVKESDIAGRMDLRALPIFTIDSAHTKDIDDAVSVVETPQGFELGVHIADVSHYVKPGSILDEEAIKRSTSVYYADQVIPMLPRQLSNGVCSLNERETRLAFSCLMHLDAKGELIDFRFVKSVIYSRVKGVYDEINEILANTASPDTVAKYHEVIAQFPAMQKLYELRKVNRKQRGCMDIESGECKLVLDDNGHCIDVKKRTRGVSEAIVEEFMLLANQAAARYARVKKAPFVYRVHEEPNAEKLDRLHQLLKGCGINYHFEGAVPKTKELSAILDATRGHANEKIVHTGLLRCMSKAKYEPEPKGHYGLVLADYAHFTSPIRRYPDLAIHRILGQMIENVPAETIAEEFTAYVAMASKQSSEREVVAMQIERKAESCYKAEYARRHLGETFTGSISGVTQRGLFIELESGVEGFVPASTLTTTGTLLIEGVGLSDPASGKMWSMGDAMQIIIVRADVNLGKVDFEVAPAV
ncbi:MAG: ribonuclease R [Faecalibacterium sp.]